MQLKHLRRFWTEKWSEETPVMLDAIFVYQVSFHEPEVHNPLLYGSSKVISIEDRKKSVEILLHHPELREPRTVYTATSMVEYFIAFMKS